MSSRDASSSEVAVADDSVSTSSVTRPSAPADTAIRAGRPADGISSLAAARTSAYTASSTSTPFSARACCGVAVTSEQNRYTGSSGKKNSAGDIAHSNGWPACSERSTSGSSTESPSYQSNATRSVAMTWRRAMTARASATRPPRASRPTVTATAPGRRSPDGAGSTAGRRGARDMPRSVPRPPRCRHPAAHRLGERVAGPNDYPCAL